MRTSTSDKRGTLSKRVAAPVLAGLLLLVALITTAATAAGPIYTDWSAPVWLGPVVNSAASETSPALSQDGLSLYFASDGPGGLGLRDIWVSQRPTVSAAWGAPVHLAPPINTTFDDFAPAFSPDGHWMFFASTRPGGFGLADIWQSYRDNIHDDFGWQTPTNLGAGVNSAALDNGVSYFDNVGAPQLFFSSNRPNVLSSGPAAHLWVSNRLADGTWGPATLILELGPGDVIRPSVRQDGLEIFFFAISGGVSDLMTATRATIDAPWSTPVNLGATVNSSSNEAHPYLSANGEVLFFYSNRAGGSGGNDLYMTTRAQIFPTTKDDCKKDDWERFGIFKNQGDCVSYVATGGTNSPG